MLNGDGLRTVLWVAGCNHCCKECQNPITWDIKGGLDFDANAKNELFKSLEPDYISGVTFSGGDPLHPENRPSITDLSQAIKEAFPNKTQWLYTGFYWEEIADLGVLKTIDILVDGPFIVEQKDTQLRWRGSANQRVIDVQASLKQNKIILYSEN